MLEQLINWDTHLFLALNGLHAPFFDGLMVWVSKTITWIPFYLLVLVAVFYKEKRNGFLVVLFIVLGIALADRVSVELFKNVFERLRPSHNPELTQFIHLVNEYRGGQFGFVSSHAANTFAFAAISSCVFRTTAYTWFVFIWAAFVSYSRIYLGVHYPADILCGGLLGVLLGFFMFFLLTKARLILAKRKAIRVP